MKDIKLIETKEIKKAILLRDVHEALQIRKQYSDWAKDQLHLFEKVNDFIVLRPKVNSEKGGRPREDHAITPAVALYITLNSRSTAKWGVVKSTMNMAVIKELFSLLEKMDLQDIPVDMFVYVARECDSGRFKIGISKHPDERIKQLNVGNPEQLELVHAYLASEGFKSEKLIHNMFEANRVRGEWFDSKTEVKQIETKLNSVK